MSLGARLQRYQDGPLAREGGPAAGALALLAAVVFAPAVFGPGVFFQRDIHAYGAGHPGLGARRRGSPLR